MVVNVVVGGDSGNSGLFWFAVTVVVGVDVAVVVGGCGSNGFSCYCRW